MKIKTRLLLGFGAIMITLVFLTIFSIYNNMKIETTITGRVNPAIENMKQTKQVQIHVIQIQQWLTDISATRAAKNFDDGFKEAQNHFDKANSILNDFEKVIHQGQNNNEMKQLIQTLKSQLSAFYNVGKEMANHYIQGGPEAGNPYMEKFDPYAEKLYKSLYQFVDHFNKLKENELNATMNLSSNNRIITLIVAVIGLIIAIIVTYLVSSSISQNINQFKNIFVKGAYGDLTDRYPLNKCNCSEVKGCNKQDCMEFGKDNVLCFLNVGSYAPDFGREILCPTILSGKIKDCTSCEVYHKICPDEMSALGAWYNSFVDKLRDLIVNIDHVSHNLASTSREINAASHTLSDAAQTQAASVEETTATLEEMNSNIHTISRSVDNVRSETQQVMLIANNSLPDVDLAKKSMNTISANSQQIQAIVKVIHDIADQTNLLSLNASIEAARAGDSGRGFAVVAQEISKLADRSAGSTKEIEQLINVTISGIENGVTLVEAAANAFNKIVQGIQGTADSIELIHQSVVQQDESASQVVNTIQGINQITESVASGSEELSASTIELNHQAEILDKLVKEFKIKKIQHEVYSMTPADA